VGIDRLQQEYRVDIRWRGFPLHPETPQEGRSLEDLFAGRGLNVAEMVQHLKAVADRLGLPFGERTMTFNSRLAQELSHWAKQCGRQEPFHKAVFEAYFVRGANIAEHSVLIDVVERSGLEAAAAARILDQRAYRSAVDRDWHSARRQGISAVPTLVLESDRLVGAQPYMELERFVQRHGAKRRTADG